jgi:FtsP/CotA-like multicopper oxidase with cupredoxin domain/peroxiredoxin
MGRNTDSRDREPGARTGTRWRLSGWSALLLLGVFGLTPAREEPAPQPPQPPQPKGALTGRAAKRPPAARVQTSLELASKTTAEFRQPPELAYQDFNELAVRVGSFDNPGAAELKLPSRFQLLCYNGESVGPTIRVRRGTTFHIRLKNELPDPKGAKGAKGAPAGAEQPHDLCTTNLHTHGLHVSPVGSADNIFLDVGPQQEFTFEYTVPADHPAGTFWYHPHHHGSVAYQLSNGLAGALIVEGGPHDGIPDLDDVPEIAAARERILLFQLYNYRVDPAGKDGVARIDARTIYDVAPDAPACPAIPVPDPDPTEVGQATAINGVINPIIRLAPGEVQRWRMIHGAWDVERRLYLSDATGKAATDLRFYEIALDGLATGGLGAKGNDPNDPNAVLVELAPGQRSDVLIQAPALRDGERERVYYLRQSAQDGTPMPPENLILAKIVVGGPPHPMRLPDPRALVRCQPFAPVRDDELAGTDRSELATRGLNFFATAPGAKVPKFTINNKTFSQYQSPVQIRLNTAEEWKVTAVSQDHPFHIHVNPFQVVMRASADGKNCRPVNVWRDTLYVRAGESYLIRSRFKDFLGKSVIHCHFLDHEDQGMMVPIEFIPPYQVPRPAVVARSQELRPMGAPAPALKLSTPEGTEHELARLRPRPVLLVFFLGLECKHCTEQLARLVREAREACGGETELVAVSSRPVPDAARARKQLGVRAGDRFHLLIDTEHRAFRAFGCDRDGPEHGLFVVDPAGVLRAGYTGPAPFADLPAVFRCFQALSTTGAK